MKEKLIKATFVTVVSIVLITANLAIGVW